MAFKPMTMKPAPRLTFPEGYHFPDEMPAPAVDFLVSTVRIFPWANHEHGRRYHLIQDRVTESVVDWLGFYLQMECGTLLWALMQKHLPLSIPPEPVYNERNLQIYASGRDDRDRWLMNKPVRWFYPERRIDCIQRLQSGGYAGRVIGQHIVLYQNELKEIIRAEIPPP